MSTRRDCKCLKRKVISLRMLWDAVLNVNIGSGGKVKKAKGRSAGDVTTDDEDIPIDTADERSPRSPVPKPKPRPVRRRAEKAGIGSPKGDRMHISPTPSVGPQTPQPSKRRGQSKTPTRGSRGSTPSHSPSHAPSTPRDGSLPLSEPPSSPSPADMATPTISRKRPHSPEGSIPDSTANEEGAGLPPDESEPQDSPIQIRRKRVRH